MPRSFGSSLGESKRRHPETKARGGAVRSPGAEAREKLDAWSDAAFPAERLLFNECWHSAIVEAQRIRRADPTNPFASTVECIALCKLGEYDEGAALAEAQYDTAVSPDRYA